MNTEHAGTVPETMVPDVKPHDALLPAMLSAKEAARYCGVGETLWRELVREGRAPEPIYLHDRVLWSRTVLDEWIKGGCLSRCSDREKYNKFHKK
jgi:predicted DNA-binding transcriptional regulator AlpA